MFKSLDEELKHDKKRSDSPLDQVLIWGGLVLLSLLTFGGLYFLVRFVH